tara:strand:+ start:2031 stop:2375 length:345 start_codon:yes stop_codon:yes gene_type:complete
MPIESRLSNKQKIINAGDAYKELLKRKGLTYFEQYATNSMTAITKDLVRNIPTDNHLWEYGDTYQKIAARYYDDPEMWWVIAWFNQKPAEFMLNVGDTILIPLELVDILRFYGY